MTEDMRENRGIYCDKCFWGEARDDKSDKIICRRMPSSLTKNAKDWCGEWSHYQRRQPV